MKPVEVIVRRHPKAATYALILLALLIVALGAYLATHKPQPVTVESQKHAETPQGVQKAAENAQAPISQAQAAEAARAIAAAKGRPPDAVILTTAQGVEKTATNYKDKVDGDFVIVTDPNNPDQPPPLPDKDGKYQLKYDGPRTVFNPAQPVNLNAYVIKAYPDRLYFVGADDSSVIVGVAHKVKIPKVPLVAPHGAVGYAGIYDRYDYKHSENHIGGMVVIPK